MSRTTWVVVANASRARIFVNSGPGKGLQLLKELLHPQSREKGIDLVSDRPNNPALGPKQNEADHFAQEVARELEGGRVNQRFAQLVIIASLPFHGVLNARLNDQVKSFVSHSIEKDYTHALEKELAQRLETVMIV